MKYGLQHNYKLIICTFLAFIFDFSFFTHTEKTSDGFFRVDKDHINCAIILDGRMYAYKGRPVGFNYELLQYYAEYCNAEIDIDPPSPSPACWDSLINGKYDIIVISASKDEIPEDYVDKVILSVPIKNENVWVASVENIALINSINLWFSGFKNTRIYNRLSNRYFRAYSADSFFGNGNNSYTLSPYDDILKKYGKFIGLDWMLLSSVVYQESQYFMGVESGQSAKGLMQIKQSTAKRYGVDDLFDPELNIKAGSLHLQYLLNMYKAEGLDSLNVIKFALASYNAGEGKIQECREHASSKGFDSNNWDEVKKSFSSMPNFIGKQTTKYVNEILLRYENYKRLTDEK